MTVKETIAEQRAKRSELLAALIERDGDHCRYCNRDFSKRERTIDHVYPQSKAFADGWTYEQVWSLDNLALACKPCNAKKGDRILNPDGTIPKRDERTFRYRRDKRAQRPEICTSCNAGRDLGPDEICASCQSGPMPERFPRWAKVKASECDHELFWCWSCSIGHTPRADSTWTIMNTQRDEDGFVE